MKMHLCLKGTLVAMEEKNKLRRKGGKQCIYTQSNTNSLDYQQRKNSKG